MSDISLAESIELNSSVPKDDQVFDDEIPDAEVQSEPSEEPPKLKRRLYLEEEDKTDEALSTFVNLEDCLYSNKHVGNCNSNDFMECDCYEDFQNGKNHACGEDSDCINRLTLIECVNDLCGTCGNDCANQRFQKKEYANIAVFKTKMKGYGVRAESDIEINDFIYEYKGEVIEEEEFRDRLVDYDQKKFRHFYFMMLQSGEFIDATIKGSLARFCNHSCNPNAYVNKWVVAGKLRMGIFAKRKILKGEEITFDYNVDRYGAAAQKCYCEEPNCIGFLGGKTQTDAASLLPQNVAEALGVKASEEKKWIKLKKAEGQKIEKSEAENINIEFLESITINPCNTATDVQKVMSVLLQIENKTVAQKLLQRLYLSSNEELLHHVIKLHGYTCFTKLLQLFALEEDELKKILYFLERLPKTTKNGIISSHIDFQVKSVCKNHSSLSSIGDSLIEKWKAYEEYKRITKLDINNSTKTKLQDIRRIKLPPGWEIVFENGRPMYYNAEKKTKLLYPPTGASKTFASQKSSSPIPKFKNKRDQNNGIKRKLTDEEYEERKRKRIELEQENIKKAKEEELQRLKAKFNQEREQKQILENIIAEANRKKEEERQNQLKIEKEKKDKKESKKQLSQISKMEHKWTKFFASVVPNILKKYESDKKIDHDDMKQCARDIVKILAAKEMKKDSSKEPEATVSKEKRHKIKQFVHGYMEKFLEKLDKKKQRH